MQPQKIRAFEFQNPPNSTMKVAPLIRDRENDGEIMSYSNTAQSSEMGLEGILPRPKTNCVQSPIVWKHFDLRASRQCPYRRKDFLKSSRAGTNFDAVPYVHDILSFCGNTAMAKDRGTPCEICIALPRSFVGIEPETEVMCAPRKRTTELKRQSQRDCNRKGNNESENRGFPA